MPVTITAAELSILHALAAPIELQKRAEFLTEVAEALERAGGSSTSSLGEGAVHRVARVVQRRYFDAPEFTTLTAPRHVGARA